MGLSVGLQTEQCDEHGENYRDSWACRLAYKPNSAQLLHSEPFDSWACRLAYKPNPFFDEKNRLEIHGLVGWPTNRTWMLEVTKNAPIHGLVGWPTNRTRFVSSLLLVMIHGLVGWPTNRTCWNSSLK